MPRPRFTLRWMFALTAILAAFSWPGGIVWQRQAMMGEGHAFVFDRQVASGPPPARLNPLRVLWGDEPIRFIYVAPEGEPDIPKLQQLFPEAEIRRENPPGDW
jgi:hypothetical protein